MRAWPAGPHGQSDFTLHSRTALAVHVMQSYSVFVPGESVFSDLCLGGVCSGSIPQSLYLLFEKVSSEAGSRQLILQDAPPV